MAALSATKRTAPRTSGHSHLPRANLKRKRTNSGRDPHKKRKRDNTDIANLEAAVARLESNPTSPYNAFTDLPLSAPTLAGLRAASFSTLTDIQSRAIPLALRGRDILGAAKTGSGKTLAFLIPVLENLFRAQWIGPDAGLGAMIIAPTRELAIQIFDVLKAVGGKGHLFAAGLIIGGKGLKEERDSLARMNIVVCTPGRILQHLSQTATFSVDNLRMLVLDEADRIMDLGFQKDVDAIIDYLPPDRQTMLFSATQTKRVSDLSRLALKDPEYISVHSDATAATPTTLQQNYTLTPLATKLDTLWSFLQSCKRAKILVFLSSAKQVRFVYESFRHLQPGIPLLHLHGRQKQTQRLEITQRFTQTNECCLFATDVVARGLDFPAVDWVVQVDCPEDADTYIHRVGRTARYQNAGRAVLFLDPSEEEGMLRRLEHKKVPIERIDVRTQKQETIRSQLQNMCFQDPQLKYLGQRAFTSYVRGLYIQKDKEIFQLDRYGLEGFAASLGLPGAPRIKFLKADADAVKKLKNRSRAEIAIEQEDESEANAGSEEEKEPETKGTKAGAVRTKYDRMFERKNQDIFADHYTKMMRGDDEKDVDLSRLDGEQGEIDQDVLFDVKRRIPIDEETEADIKSATLQNADPPLAKTVHIPGARAPLVLDSNRRLKLLQSKKKLLKLKDKGSKVVFDDDGVAHPIYELEKETDFHARGPAASQREQFVESEMKRVQEDDKEDKAVAREKRREKIEKRKRREREERDAGSDDGAMVAGTGEEDAMANFLADAAAFGDGDKNHKDSRHGINQKPRKKENERLEMPQDDREIATLDELEAEALKVL